MNSRNLHRLLKEVCKRQKDGHRIGCSLLTLENAEIHWAKPISLTSRRDLKKVLIYNCAANSELIPNGLLLKRQCHPVSLRTSTVI